jgi:tRNA-specific 2-thiouridylase
MNPLPEKTIASTRVMVGMSGGVDSSVAALLLLEQGYQVEGLFMKNWDEDDGTEYCTAKGRTSPTPRRCAISSASNCTPPISPPSTGTRCSSHFLSEYRAGRTPNPDVLCNREIKFKVFAEYAELLGADQIATGHYARLDRQGGQTRLLKGLDANKDQSYFLHAVSAQQFARSHFPVGANCRRPRCGASPLSTASSPRARRTAPASASSVSAASAIS